MFSKINRFILILVSTFCVVGIYAQEHTVGVMVYEEETSDGYVLFTDRNREDAFLIDNCGRKVHEWNLGDADTGIFQHLELLPNGMLIQHPSFLGGAISLFDWDSNLIWKMIPDDLEVAYVYEAEFLSNGNFLLLGSRTRDDLEEIGFDGELSQADKMNELILHEITPDYDSTDPGNFEIVWEWNLLDHSIQDLYPDLANFGVVDEHPELIDLNNEFLRTKILGTDPWYPNAIDYDTFYDRVLINARGYSEMWIVDHSTTAEEALGHSGGNSGKGGDLMYRWGNPIAYDRGTDLEERLFGIHGPNFVKQGLAHAGSIIYFNNRPYQDYSTVEMIRPEEMGNGDFAMNAEGQFLPEEPVLLYEAPVPQDFHSSVMSNALITPNGNVFINSGDEGPMLEVNDNMDILWEYITPVAGGEIVEQGDLPYWNNNFRAYKYPLDYEGFEGKDLSAGLPLEGDSEFNFCNVTSSIEEVKHSSFLLSVENKHLVIQDVAASNYTFQIFNSAGNVVVPALSSDEESISVNLNFLPRGVYIFNLIHGEESSSQRFILH